MIDAGDPFSTRPAASKREPWHGQTNPLSMPGPSAASSADLSSGIQPKCVQIAVNTMMSARRERVGLATYAGCSESEVSGSFSSPLRLASCAITAGLRRTIQTGVPRHKIFTPAPSAILVRSISAGRPATLVCAVGCQDARNGTAAYAAPTTANVVVALTRKCLRDESIGVIAMLSALLSRPETLPHPRSAATGQTIRVATRPMPPVMGDAIQLQQVLVNLIVNARTLSPIFRKDPPAKLMRRRTQTSSGLCFKHS